MSPSSAVAIESLSKEQVDIFIREEQLDDADPLRHLQHQDSADLLPLVPAQPPSIRNETLHLNFQDIAVTLQVDAGPGCGGIAWPAGEVLSRYIVRQGRDYWRGKRVLELGSGTGLVGLVAGYLGAHTVLTDQRPILELMRENVLLNGLQETVEVLELNWGEPLPVMEPFNVILAADCVYFEPAFPLLIQTLEDLATQKGRKPDFLFCYKKRRKADRRFFSLLKKRFAWVEVEDPDRPTYSRDAISLLRLSGI